VRREKSFFILVPPIGLNCMDMSTLLPLFRQ